MRTESSYCFRASIAFAIVAFLSAPAAADDIVLTNAWIRALPVGSDAGYFVLKNAGSADRVLTGATSPACGMLMLHKTTSVNGVTNMTDVASVNLPSGAEVKFEPNGYHLMCDRPRPAIKPGAKIPVTLQFADGTKATADFAVKDAKGN